MAFNEQEHNINDRLG